MNPWVIFGLGHRVLDTARACIRRAIDLYDRWLNARDGTKMHWFAVALLTGGTRARHELERFANGADMNDFVKKLAARCRFTWTSDRFVEMLHARHKHYIVASPNAGPVHVAYFSAKEAIMDLIDGLTHAAWAWAW